MLVMESKNVILKEILEQFLKKPIVDVPKELLKRIHGWLSEGKN